MPSLRCPVRGTWSLSEAPAGEAKKQVGVKGEGAAFPLKRAKGEVFAPPMEERHQPRPPSTAPSILYAKKAKDLTTQGGVRPLGSATDGSEVPGVEGVADPLLRQRYGEGATPRLHGKGFGGNHQQTKSSNHEREY